MAPDLNSVPPSPHSLNSRHVSQSTAQPPADGPSNAASVIPRRDSFSTSPPLLTGSTSHADGIGPGPLRHPRPLTAAELHLELEKEQEAVVNRLSRELALLRQQTASVASTASSVSTGIQEGPDSGHGHVLSGPTHPTSTRQRRSSSNLSSQSASLSGLNSSVSGIAPARDAAAAPTINARGRSSRHGSMNTRRPELVSISQAADQPGSTGRSPGGLSHSTSPANIRSLPHSQSSASATSRIEEIAQHRFELENVRRENESLRRRVQELERELQRTLRSSRLESGVEESSS